MKLNQYVDVLIPRGGAGLIRYRGEEQHAFRSSRPVPETAIFLWMRAADLDMAVDIIFNAKTQRIGVCNACESLVIHEKTVG